jgi:hypothetical protein
MEDIPSWVRHYLHSPRVKILPYTHPLVSRHPIIDFDFVRFEEQRLYGRMIWLVVVLLDLNL